MATFTQDSEIGRLGLSALVNSGFCGPPCGLSESKVRVDSAGEDFTVRFYDMSIRVSPGNTRYYNELKAAMGVLAA
jgi:hypothetical protein